MSLDFNFKIFDRCCDLFLVVHFWRKMPSQLHLIIIERFPMKLFSFGASSAIGQLSEMLYEMLFD